MAFGLRAFNDGGEYTISADAYTYGYIGKASFTTLTNPGTDPNEAGAGGSFYTINWPGQIVCAIPIKANGATVLVDQAQSGDTWTVKIHKATGAYTAFGFEEQEQTEVFVFGAPTAVSGWGCAMWNQAGQLTADLSRRPLAVGKFMTLAEGVLEGGAISGFTKPAIIGGDATRIITRAPTGALWINKLFYGAWRWNQAAGRLERERFLVIRTRDDGPFAPEEAYPPSAAILIEAAGLT
jgi:hypothetical protein